MTKPAPRPPKPTTRLTIDYMPLATMRRFPGNPRSHADESIRGSVELFGFNDPIAIDEKSGHMSEGHGRLDALEAMRAAGKAPPAHVEVSEDGTDWLVPVVRGAAFRSKAELERYIVAHNQTTIAGGWTNEGRDLAGILQRAQAAQVPMVALGFDGEALRRMSATAAAAPKAVEDIAVATSEVRDEFWLTIRGPLPAQRDALDVLRAKLGKLDGVTVDMGTIKRDGAGR